jgi:hypothetical protein
MSDNDDCLTMDDFSSNYPDDTDNKTSSITASTLPDDEPALTNISVIGLAASLVEDKNITFNLSREEEEFIQGSTVNTKHYEKNKVGHRGSIL